MHETDGSGSWVVPGLVPVVSAANGLVSDPVEAGVAMCFPLRRQMNARGLSYHLLILSSSATIPGKIIWNGEGSQIMNSLLKPHEERRIF